jgi:sulfur relay (sulfurtransferase) complex TusBCD TusD component (DsrE family)
VGEHMFTSYIMFQHQGPLNLEQILASANDKSRLQNTIKRFYLEERMSILLCIQALFRGMTDPDVAYKVNLMKSQLGRCIIVIYV